jgi:hypothetical protein
MTDHELLEQSFHIAWDVLSRSEDLADRNASASFLVDKIHDMMKCGERRRLLLSNLAIDAYRARYPSLDLAS